MSDRDMVSKAEVLDTYAELYDEFDDAHGVINVLHKVYDKLERLQPQDIVRCKDCKHRPTYPNAYGAEINGNWCYWCELHRSWKTDDWFCADGKRR